MTKKLQFRKSKLWFSGINDHTKIFKSTEKFIQMFNMFVWRVRKHNDVIHIGYCIWQTLENMINKPLKRCISIP